MTLSDRLSAPSSRDDDLLDLAEPPLLAQLTWILMVAYLIFNRLVADIYTLPVGVSLHITDAVLAMMLMTLALWMLTSPRPFPGGAPAIAGTALVVVLLIAPIVNVNSLTDFESNGAERGLVRGILYVGMFLAAYHLAARRDWAYGLIRISISLSVIQALMAAVERMTGTRFRALGVIWLAMGMEVDPRGMRDDEVLVGGRLTGELRASATAPHSLVLAGMLVASIGMCAVLYLYSESKRERRRYLVAIMVQLVGLGATNQRTGFVALIAVVLLLAVTSVHRLPSAIPLISAGVLGLAAMTIVSPDTPRLMLDFFTGRATDHNVDVRTSKYAFVSQLLGERPIIGPGFFTGDPNVVIFDNAYLTQLIELGVLGMFLLMAFLLTTMWRPFSAYQTAPSEEQPLLLCAMCVGVTLLVTMATFDVLSFNQLFPMSLIILAIGLARTDAVRRAGRRSRFG